MTIVVLIFMVQKPSVVKAFKMISCFNCMLPFLLFIPLLLNVNTMKGVNDGDTLRSIFNYIYIYIYMCVGVTIYYYVTYVNVHIGQEFALYNVFPTGLFEC